MKSASARSPRTKRPPRGRGGATDPPRIELQRARRLVAAAEAVRKFPFEGISDAGANGREGVSREAFADHLEALVCVLTPMGKKGITSSTFKATPDVPFNTFALQLPHGRYSALTANTNLCKPKTHLAIPTEYHAQNEQSLHTTTPIQITNCHKPKPSHKHHARHKHH